MITIILLYHYDISVGTEVMVHIVAYNSLLGNNSETENETMAIARQQLCKYATILEARQRPARDIESIDESGVFHVVSSDAISLERPSSVHLVQCSAVQ
jgi:hypothetical protein